MRIRDTDLFKNVSKGRSKEFKARLAKELAVVRKANVDRDEMNHPPLLGHEIRLITLMTAFIWGDTPQGVNFWGNIFEGKEFP